MKINQIKKKDGTTVYRASVYLGIDSQTGRKARTTVTAKTQKAVKVKAREALNEFERNGNTTKKQQTVKTYADLVALWWDSYKDTVKPNSRQTMEGMVRLHLLPVFGSYKLDKLTTPIIQKQVNEWARKANNGVDGAFANYSLLNNINKRILQFAVSMQLIPFNPTRDIIVPRKNQNTEKKIKFFSNSELKSFLEYLEELDLSNFQNLFDYTLYRFLLATGCRIGEALALEWSDVDLDSASININKTLNRKMETNLPKSKAGIRIIDIDSDTVTILKEYKKRQQMEAWKLGRTEVVVFTPFVRRYDYPFLTRRRLKKHFRLAGVPDIGFHGFRHTHATIMVYSGIEPKDLQYRLGHSDISTTLNTYVHATKEGAKKAPSFFEKAINNL
ncbi:site-specific integrase [Streptococcus danieliae]|uniref:tyrosine-type recombinase/integrase n=1 Tax=Streptococcus danieliae TaxID=747656 RepID=UPI0026EC42E7|nr:site-specific integrase [Streptococcus danieliae]